METTGAFRVSEKPINGLEIFKRPSNQTLWKI
jgi:hypothetical protein